MSKLKQKRNPAFRKDFIGIERICTASGFRWKNYWNTWKYIFLKVTQQHLQSMIKIKRISNFFSMHKLYNYRGNKRSERLFFFSFGQPVAQKTSFRNKFLFVQAAKMQIYTIFSIMLLSVCFLPLWRTQVLKIKSVLVDYVNSEQFSQVYVCR